MEQPLNTVFLCLGSNRGDRMHYLDAACAGIIAQAGEIVACSPVFESEPWGFSDETQFLNCVVSLRTLLTPRELLFSLTAIEQSLGRSRVTNLKKEYLSRTIDIDILFYNDLVCREPGLVIPHPGIPDRRFVLVPLAALTPSFVHPGSGLTVTELLEACDDLSQVKEFSTPLR